jgi:hypothetical protein
MTYKVPAAKKSKDQNRFEIDIDVEVKGKIETRHFEIPSMKYMKPDIVARAELMPNTSGSKFLINSVAPGLFELFEDGEQFNDFMEAWQEFSGITVGESSASSDS